MKFNKFVKVAAPCLMCLLVAGCDGDKLEAMKNSQNEQFTALNARLDDLARNISRDGDAAAMTRVEQQLKEIGSILGTGSDAEGMKDLQAQITQMADNLKTILAQVTVQEDVKDGTGESALSKELAEVREELAALKKAVDEQSATSETAALDGITADVKTVLGEVNSLSGKMKELQEVKSTITDISNSFQGLDAILGDLSEVREKLNDFKDVEESLDEVKNMLGAFDDLKASLVRMQIDLENLQDTPKSFAKVDAALEKIRDDIKGVRAEAGLDKVGGAISDLRASLVGLDELRLAVSDLKSRLESIDELKSAVSDLSEEIKE